MARPTKLTEQLLENVKQYITYCREKNRLPTIEGLARLVDLNKTTIYAWRKETGPLHQEFSNLIEDMLNEQADILVNKGLSGDYNPTIAKVLLTKHGYREGVETDITSQGDKITGSPILPEVIAEADRLLKERKLNQ